ncbi:hypothetical protein BDK51DRAFT_23434, partial [Blyttiomyces helicus]
HPNTRICVRLLGPCFKTGRLKPFCKQKVHELLWNSAEYHNQQAVCSVIQIHTEAVANCIKSNPKHDQRL